MTTRTIHLQTLDACASTQHEVRTLLDADATRLVVVRTRRQLQGLGRAGRTWHTPPEPGLMLSIGVRGVLCAATLHGLVRDIVDDLRHVLADLGGVATDAIAWSAPNDLVDAARGDKLAGVLVDAVTVGDELRELVVGIGANVHGAAFDLPGETRRAVTLEHVAGRLLDVDDAALDRVALELAARVARRVGVTLRAAPSA